MSRWIFFRVFENNDNTHEEKTHTQILNQIQSRSSQGEDCKVFFRGFLKNDVTRLYFIFSFISLQSNSTELFTFTLIRCQRRLLLAATAIDDDRLTVLIRNLKLES